MNDFFKSLIDFKAAHADLVEKWNALPAEARDAINEHGANTYPFDRSFDEINVKAWAESLVNKIFE